MRGGLGRAAESCWSGARFMARGTTRARSTLGGFRKCGIAAVGRACYSLLEHDVGIEKPAISEERAGVHLPRVHRFLDFRFRKVRAPVHPTDYCSSLQYFSI